MLTSFPKTKDLRSCYEIAQLLESRVNGKGLVAHHELELRGDRGSTHGWIEGKVELNASVMEVSSVFDCKEVGAGGVVNDFGKGSADNLSEAIRNLDRIT